MPVRPEDIVAGGPPAAAEDFVPLRTVRRRKDEDRADLGNCAVAVAIPLVDVDGNLTGSSVTVEFTSDDRRLSPQQRAALKDIVQTVGRATEDLG